MIASLIAKIVGWTATVFYRAEVAGGPLPKGPVLITANHPNSLLDPLLVFRAAGRPARPLAKAPLFDQVFVGAMLRALGGLPVYRKQDDASLMHRNDQTFTAAIGALRAGDTVQIFPEGRSHSEPSLVELRTGAARIALGAEAESGWTLGLHIVPAGITYRRKALFRGSALVSLGEPYTIADLRELYERDAQTCVHELTARIDQHLRAVTLNLSQHEDAELIETAEALYVREKGVTGFRDREGLGARLPRLQRFAQGLAWLRAHDPARHERLSKRVGRYHKLAALLGAADADVPRRYSAGSVVIYGLRESLYLLIGAPLALIGSLIWYIPYFIPRIAARVIAREPEAVATYKLAAGFFGFPLFLALYVGIAWRLAGPTVAIAVAIAAPLLGFIALAWRERWARVREDVSLFFRAIARPKTTGRLALYREQLVREFDAIDAVSRGVR